MSFSNTLKIAFSQITQLVTRRDTDLLTYKELSQKLGTKVTEYYKKLMIENGFYFGEKPTEELTTDYQDYKYGAYPVVLTAAIELQEFMQSTQKENMGEHDLREWERYFIDRTTNTLSNKGQIGPNQGGGHCGGPSPQGWGSWEWPCD